MNDVIDLLEGKDFSINVISKSGTTTEPAIAFRIFRKLLKKSMEKKKHANEFMRQQIKQRGALKTVANEEGYETFVIPDDVGGRYSVLTAVGLLPIAVSGADIEAMMKGAAAAREDFSTLSLRKILLINMQRFVMFYITKGKQLKCSSIMSQHYSISAEWWKQLFGESEGKDQKGIYPSSANFSTDLHSLGQYVQEGRRDLFETVIKVDKPRHELTIEED